MSDTLEWIEHGRRFTVDDMVFFQGAGEVPLTEVLHRFDLVITGPHASAALPRELAPFVDPRFTRRLQLDFTDVSTSPVARRWAAIDPRVLYIEDPHPRAVRDANRPRPADLLAGLREAFRRLREAGEGGRPPLGGVDAVRPVTFAYLPVYREPDDEAGWQQLGDALAAAGALGIDVYEEVRDRLIHEVIEAKCRHLTTLDPSHVSVADWRSATTLLVLSIHDTMNHTARSDGALCMERKPEDRLPAVVALSNRGDAHGEVRGSADGRLLAAADVPTLDPRTLRAIATAYRRSFDAWGPDDVVFNRPYLGGHETQLAGPMLRDLAPRTSVRTADGGLASLTLGAWQNEFLREFLLGEDATRHLMAPGTDWAGPPAERVAWLAERLKGAHDLVRRWGAALGPGR